MFQPEWPLVHFLVWWLRWEDQFTVHYATRGQLVLSVLRKTAQQALGSQPVSSNSLQPLLQFLQPGSCHDFPQLWTKSYKAKWTLSSPSSWGEVWRAFLFLILCAWLFCLHIRLCTMCVQQPQKPEEGVESPGTEVTEGCHPHYGYWE